MRHFEKREDGRCLVYSAAGIPIRHMDHQDAERYVNDAAFAARIEKQEKEADYMAIAAMELNQPEM